MPEMTPYEDAVPPAWLRDLPPSPPVPAELAGPTGQPERNLAILVLSEDGLGTDVLELLGDYLAEVARFHAWWDPAADPDPQGMLLLARKATAGVHRIYHAYRAHTRARDGHPADGTTLDTLRTALRGETAALAVSRLGWALSTEPSGETAAETSPAHLAVEHEDLPALRAVLDSGADVHEEEGALTLLHHAVDVEVDGHNQTGEPLHVDVTAFLLARGADPLRRSGRGSGVSALELAFTMGHWLAHDLMTAWTARRPAGG
jgi:hypothetical protein